MHIKNLQATQHISEHDIRMNPSCQQFQQFIELINQRDLPSPIIDRINEHIDFLNNSRFTLETYIKPLRQAQSKITNILAKELKIVPINYYRNLWLALGLTTFGLPIGVAIGTILDNIGLLGIGLPFGSAIGYAVGTHLDKKAKEEGRLIDIELKRV